MLDSEWLAVDDTARVSVLFVDGKLALHKPQFLPNSLTPPAPSCVNENYTLPCHTPAMR